MLSRFREKDLFYYIIWFFLYLAISLVVYNDILRTGISTSIPDNKFGNGDWGMMSTFIAWVPYVLIHHVNPFYSNYMLALHGGVNMMSQTPDYTQALVLTPFTLMFGVVTSINIGIILVPVVCALPAAIVFHKMTSYRFESVVGGLLCGFGRGLVSANATIHFNLVWMFAPPIVIFIYYRVLKEQNIKIVKTGIILGLVMTLQFYAGTEQTLDTLYVSLTAGVVILAIDSKLIRSRFFRLLGVTFIAGIVGAILCGYAVYVFLYGKAHVFVTREMWDSVENYNILNAFLPRNAAHNGVNLFGNDFASITIPLVAVVIVISRIHKMAKFKTAKVAMWMCLILFLAMIGPLLQIWGNGPLQPNPIYYIVRHLPIIYAVLYRRLVYYEEFFLGLSLVYALASIRPLARHAKATLISKIFNIKSLLAFLVLINLLWNGSYLWNIQSKFYPNPVLSSKTYLPQNKIIWVYPRMTFNSGYTAIYLAQSGLRYKIPSAYANVIVDGQNSIMIAPSPFRSYVESNTKPSVKPQSDVVSGVKNYVKISKIACVVIYDASRYKGYITKIEYLYGAPTIVGNTVVWCHLNKT